MRMAITNNSGYVLETSQIFVAWNTAGADRNGELRLKLISGNLGGTFWSNPAGEPNSPKVFVPGTISMPTIPKGSSSIVFTFNYPYLFRNGTETIVITIGTNGCNGLTLTGK